MIKRQPLRPVGPPQQSAAVEQNNIVLKGEASLVQLGPNPRQHKISAKCEYIVSDNIVPSVMYVKPGTRYTIYDIVLVLNYNTNPTIKNKGSAIFIHIAKNNYSKTKGCIALKKNNLIKLLSYIKSLEKIKII